MVGRWKFLLGWHVFGGHIDIGYRIIPSLNVLWILPMAQRWRWKAWLAGSGTWQYGIDEEKWMKIKYKIMNTYQLLQTRINVGQQGRISKVYREIFAISTQLRNLYLPLWLLQWSYITNLIPRRNSKNLFRAFLSKSSYLKISDSFSHLSQVTSGPLKIPRFFRPRGDVEVTSMTIAPQPMALLRGTSPKASPANGRRAMGWLRKGVTWDMGYGIN